MIVIPAVVRNKARAVGAEAWIEELPALIRSFEREWSIVVGRPYEDGTEAFVAEAILDDGTPAVLKLIMPRHTQAATQEITVLRLTDGVGCVALFRADEKRGALLLERLGRSMHELALPIATRHEILVDTAQRVWRPAPGCGLPTGADKGRGLMGYIAETWERLDRPCSERAVDHAIACAQRRAAAHDDERAVLVHGDVHEWNALECYGGFKLVDPDGLLIEAEYDMGILMREDPLDLLQSAGGDPRSRSRWLAKRTGLDEIAIWEWGVAERVSTGLLATEVDLQPVAGEMLQVADVIARDFAD